MLAEDMSIFFDTDGFAVTATWAPISGGAQQTAQVILDAPDNHAVLGEVTAIAREYSITYPASSLVGLDTGEAIVVNGVEHIVREVMAIDDGVLMQATLGEVCGMSTVRELTGINEIIIHCSDSENGKDVSAQDIDAWHGKRGFMRDSGQCAALWPHLKHIGYHYVISVRGGTWQGRGLNEIGAHAKGHNATSIGICMVGRDKFTIAQWVSLAALVTHLLREFPAARVIGHRDCSPDTDGDGTVEPGEWLKECPCFEVGQWVANNMRALPEHVIQPQEAAA